MIVVIYGLREIGSDAIRYVGKSCNPCKRLREHIREANSSDCYKDRWIRKSKGIELIELEMALASEWQERERYWIQRLRLTGHPLTNTTLGGEGFGSGSENPMFGKKRPDLVKRNRARAGIKNPDHAKRMIGKKNPFLSALNKSRTGIKRSNSTRLKISKALKGRSQPWTSRRNRLMRGSKHPFFGKRRPDHSAFLIGRRHSRDTIIKMRQSARLRWRNEKLFT